MEWKIFKTKLEVYPHKNADKLELAKAGQFQFVVMKGLYQTGDDAFVIPEKSVLPDALKVHWEAFLKGPDKNRVGSIRLRNEASQGILLSMDKAKEIWPDIETAEYGTDVSEFLGITKYEPPIPPQFAGQMKPLQGEKHYFDCTHYSISEHEFKDDDEVVVSEKVHGTQCNYQYDCRTGEEQISSKGLLSKGISIVESESNIYWRAIREAKLKEFIEYMISILSAEDMFEKIQFTGEVVPCQPGYSYGFTKPTFLAFNIAGWNSKDEPFKTWFPNEEIAKVPVLFRGRYGDIKDKLHAMAEGMETISGKGLHIREGIVVRPVPDRRDFAGDWLRLKIINPKYKESGEELS